MWFADENHLTTCTFFQTQVTQSKTNLSDNQTTGRLRLLGDQLWANFCLQPYQLHRTPDHWPNTQLSDNFPFLDAVTEWNRSHYLLRSPGLPAFARAGAQLNRRGEGGESKTATAAAATTVAKPPSCNAMVRSQSGNGRSLEKYIFGCNFEEI